MAGNLLPLGCDVRVRGERAVLRHVVRVPKSKDMFGRPLRAHWRAIVTYDDGRYDDHIDLFELQPIDA